MNKGGKDTFKEQEKAAQNKVLQEVLRGGCQIQK